MGQRTWKLLLLIWICNAAMPVWAAEIGTLKEYVIGTGDVIDISVRQDETLTRSVTVLPDGRISVPLVGQLMAGGKTIAKLTKELEEKISVFIPKVALTVGVSVNSMLIYVIGEVKTPGQFVLNTHMNILQALALAGGFSDFAKKNSIKIFRVHGEKIRVLNFRYGDVAKGKNLEQNIWLKRGDVIVVP